LVGRTAGDLEVLLSVLSVAASGRLLAVELTPERRQLRRQVLGALGFGIGALGFDIGAFGFGIGAFG
jgi:hypothetical protein